MTSPEGTRASLFLRLNSDSDDVRELAWDEFYRRYHPIIVRFALQQGASASEAEDASQDVMLGFYSTSAEFEYTPQKGRFRGYLKACVCRAISRQRQKRRREVDAGDTLHAAAEDVQRVWDELWEQRLMELAVAELAEQQSSQSTDIFRKCVLDGATPQSVATNMGLTVDAVYKSRQRSVVAFKGILANLAADELYC